MNVNYMMEIITLDDWELTHQLDPTAFKVLRKLYYLANKERFPERIFVPNTMLMALVGCGEDSLIKARQRLMSAGRIAYKGQKKMTPMYSIHYFSLDHAYNPKLQSYEQGIERGYKQGIEQGYTQGNEQGTYINKTKGDGTEPSPEEDTAIASNKHEDARARKDYFPPRRRELTRAEKFCHDSLLDRLRTSPMFSARYEFLESVLGSDRFSVDLIVEAYKATEKRNKRYPGPLDNPTAYLMELLYDWEERGIKTSEDVHAAKDDWYAR